MEEVILPSTESGAGFEPATVHQFTVFLENRVGRLTLLVRALEETTRIVALAIEESAESALARVICSDSEAGRYLLGSHGFTFSEVDVLVIRLPHRSEQPLLSICSALLGAEINIHYVYPLLVCPGGPAVVIYCDDIILGAQLLMRKGYTIIGESDFKNPPPDNSADTN